MKKILFVVLFVLASCNTKSCFPQPESVQIKPGTYVVTITDQDYSCTDGTHQSGSVNQTGEWTITNNNDQWKLYLAVDADPNLVLDCKPNGPGLSCSQNGSVTIPNLCTYPFTVTMDLNHTDEGFIGTSVWVYRFVVCTNGNTGNCTMTSNLEGVLQ